LLRQEEGHEYRAADQRRRHDSTMLVQQTVHHLCEPRLLQADGGTYDMPGNGVLTGSSKPVDGAGIQRSGTFVEKADDVLGGNLFLFHCSISSLASIRLPRPCFSSVS